MIRRKILVRSCHRIFRPGFDGNNGDIINLDHETRGQRLDGLRQWGWKAQNADEPDSFLGDVYHETDGFKSLTEYFAPGKV